MKVIISGGGTGGHVFPAIAIADAIKTIDPVAEILFVGAKGKLEMERVPKAGYPIKGLWISGFQRKLSLQNLLFPLKLASSLLKAGSIIRSFRPDVLVGVGGYASGPTLEMGIRMGIPALIQEQNSFPGITNRLLGKRVDRICVAYEGMQRFFPQDRILLTGNPVRKDLKELEQKKPEAALHFQLEAGKKTILVMGGSGGALSLNEAMARQTERLAAQPDVQVLWQAGKWYYERYKDSATAALPQVRLFPFLERMDLAYALADVVACRSGALTISELCLLGKPAVLVPSPNVAEDHQTKNAQAIAGKGGAVLVADDRAVEDLLSQALILLDDGERLAGFSKALKKLARPDADRQIAQAIFKLVK